MPNAVRLSDLSEVPPEERAGIFRRLAEDAAATPNGRADYALARVRHYEAVYECKSEHLGERLRAGTIRETAEVAHWLFCLKLLSLSGR
jgi:hypothetical protein